MPNRLRCVSRIVLVTTLVAASPGRLLAWDRRAPWTDLACSVDGRPATAWLFSLTGDDGKAEGDGVIALGDILLRTGSERRCAFSWDEEDDGRLLAVGQDGRERLVGVVVRGSHRDGQPVIANPLVGLSAAELRALRGVLIEDVWSEELAAQLRQLDPTRSCLRLVSRANPPMPRVPALPASTECLELSEGGHHAFADLSGLGQLAGLKYLFLDLSSRRELDARALAPLGRLRYLESNLHETLRNARSLGELRQLRGLDLRWTQLSDIEFTHGLSALRTIDLSHTQVHDLGPLVGLAHLREVNANETPVTRLPRGRLPALRLLSVLSTKLSTAEVAAFRRANPSCRVERRWKDALQGRLAGATRVRIRSHADDPCAGPLTTLVTKRSAPAIAALARALAVEDDEEPGSSGCCGGLVLEFFRGKRLLAAVTRLSPWTLHWDGWPGEGTLTRASKKALDAWLAAEKVPAHEWKP